jgi:putative transposase
MRRLWMRRKRFSLEQMIGALKQAEPGVPVAEVIRKAGISEQTFYCWKAKYAGLEVDQVRQMAQLQEENLRLRQLVAELTLDKAMLRLNFARQMLGKRTPRGTSGASLWRDRFFSQQRPGHFFFAPGCLQFFKLQLQLLDLADDLLALGSKEHPLQLVE